MSKSLRMLMETVAFQTALDYSNTTPDLVTLTRHFGQQKEQDAAPGETAKAHGAELGEHSEQRGKKTHHDDGHGSNGTTPGAGAGAGAGSRVGVTLFRTLLLSRPRAASAPRCAEVAAVAADAARGWFPTTS